MPPAEFEIGGLQIVKGERHFGNPIEVKAGTTDEDVLTHENEELKLKVECDSQDSGSLISYSFDPWDIRLSVFGLNLSLSLLREPSEGTQVIKTGETFSREFKTKSRKWIGFKVTQVPKSTT